MLSPSLPAATTSSTPLSLASSTALCSALDFDEDPNEQLTILAPSCTAYSIASTAPAVPPRPRESRNFTDMTDAFQQMPDTPAALLPTAAMMPATCVPWPLSSRPEPLPLTMFTP